MKSPCAILALLSVLLFASTTSTVESRKDPAGEYWRTVMIDQAMPEAIHALLGYNSDSTAKNSNEKTNGHGTLKSNAFTDDFEPTPNASAYPDGDAKAAESAFVKAKTYYGNYIVGSEAGKPFAEDFKPSPHVTAYNE